MKFSSNNINAVGSWLTQLERRFQHLSRRATKTPTEVVTKTLTNRRIANLKASTRSRGHACRRERGSRVLHVAMFGFAGPVLALAFQEVTGVNIGVQTRRCGSPIRKNILSKVPTKTEIQGIGLEVASWTECAVSSHYQYPHGEMERDI
jgi:hypothetical protein